MITTGACVFGAWSIEVSYEGTLVHRVRFLRTAPFGSVPYEFIQYLAGQSTTFSPLTSIAVLDTRGPYVAIYRAVMQIPYGETRTYGEIAQLTGTHARVVGTAMSRNPTPLIIPCHRVVAAKGMGGFSPDPEIKRNLLALETRVINMQQCSDITD